MSTVDTVEIENIANSLKNIAYHLQEDYDSIKDTVDKINSCLKTLKSWNGNDAINTPYPYEQIPYFDGMLENILYKKRYYKYIWNINVQEGDSSNQSALDLVLSQIQENISLLDLESDDLNLLASTLFGFITNISSLLQVDYDGDMTKFFNEIKDTPGWQFEKANAEESVQLKETDELYLAFRSKDGNDDFVDFLLDELGNRRFPQGMAGVLDHGNQSDRGASEYAQWYIDYYTKFPNSNSNVEAMNNDAAYCATAVTYALVNSGNEGVIEPFISVATGASNVKSMAENGNGVWHSASDESYHPQRGDIFYKVGGENGNHVGIVLESAGDYIYTIEGNTASNIESFGTVNTRVRPLSYVNTGNSLAGYYSPNVYINQSATDVNISETTISDKTNPAVMNNNNN